MTTNPIDQLLAEIPKRVAAIKDPRKRFDEAARISIKIRDEVFEKLTTLRMDTVNDVRDEKGWSFTDLADFFGVSKGHIAHISWGGKNSMGGDTSPEAKKAQEKAKAAAKREMKSFVRDTLKTHKADQPKGVVIAREGGATWADIGEALGTTRQAAQQRFG